MSRHTKGNFKNALFIYQTKITEPSRNPAIPMRCCEVNEPSWELGRETGNQERAITTLLINDNKHDCVKESHQCLRNYSFRSYQVHIRKRPIFLLNIIKHGVHQLVKKDIASPVSSRQQPYHFRSRSNANYVVYSSKKWTALNLWTTKQKGRFADSPTNKTSPTHPRAWGSKEANPFLRQLQRL